MSAMTMSLCSTYQSHLVSFSSKVGVVHCRSCQQGFCCSGMFGYLPSTSSYSPFKYCLVQKVFGVDQSCGAATALQTADSGSHAVTCWILWWVIAVHFGELCKCSSLLQTCLFSLNLTNPLSILFSLICLICVFLLIPVHLFIYCLIFFPHELVSKC